MATMNALMMTIQEHRAAQKGLLQNRLEEDPCWKVPHVPPTTQSVKGLSWTEQKWT